ncbi:hypothetical protein OPU71_18035 [Niveibacterium sp. 24ML]|uniref:hypothetical protein n=1 Tax=Niveibacterium sp. 24ML TaxID=2985512 RepID=UPI00226FCD39|nr:hypothetical protein [Niveibacterium sp. 24ML]MCX9158028.1 hypothetical protein [Niveibacterium sp. 24ML]
MERNLSREAHLWYSITSPEFMDRARSHLQDAFDQFEKSVKQHAFIADYPPVPRGGGRLEHLLRTYANARALMEQGEYSEMLRWGGYLENTPRVFEESNMAWMEDKAGEFMSTLESALSVCSDFGFAVTMSEWYSSEGFKAHPSDWKLEIPEDAGIPGDHIARFYEESLLVPRPSEIPEYKADESVSCATGQIVPWTGVWVPADGMGKAALAFARQGIQIMQPAYHLIREDEDTGDEQYDVVECAWHPVKPTGRMIPFPGPFKREEAEDVDGPLRCVAGQPCPQAGWWSTPAKVESRRHLNQGEVMPDLDSDYGATIWQWDVDQS